MKILEIRYKKSGTKCFYFLGIKVWSKKKSKIDIIYSEISLIKQALGDMKGLGFLNLLLRQANVLPIHDVVFQKMKEGDICIDGGANIGMFTDICKHQGALVYAFEPNNDAFAILQRKYKTDNHIKLYNEAIWVDNCYLNFFHRSDENDNFIEKSQSATLINHQNSLDHELVSNEQVKAINFCQFIQKEFILSNKNIYLMKLDIEGAEFEVLKQMIENNIYQYVKYIFVETHERFFSDGENKIQELKSLIKQKNITNIYLDWV